MEDKKEKPSASITDTLQYVSEQMCTNYCNWRDKYQAEYSDVYEAEEKMMKEQCDHCPLVDLI